MKIGFTGTQRGMTSQQRDSLRSLLRAADELHHGDCIGADAQAHLIASELGLSIAIHPPSLKAKRAFMIRRTPGGYGVDELGTYAIYGEKLRQYGSKPYLQRNRDIVDSTDELVATPHTAHEVLRSGTWSTVRYAHRVGKRATIILPDGLVVPYSTLGLGG